AAWEEGRKPDLECLALFVGRGAVDFDAPDPRADLIVTAALETANEAGEVEGVGNLGSGRSRERGGGQQWAVGNDGSSDRANCARSARSTRVRTNVAAGPRVDRRWRRRWCICRHRPFGSERRRRTQAQRDQRYASEKQLFHGTPQFLPVYCIAQG